MLGRPKFVLASGSPRRLSLLNQAGIEPDALRPADVDETPKRGELPRACANHRVYTAVCLVTPKEAFRQRLIETRVRFKRLSEDDIQAYIGSGEWRGKAGGYAVQGIAGSFVVKMVGSYTNIVGLPLYESVTLLGGEGFPIRFGWLNAS
jgi:predicted house-cleaning NTP pyrophosphatase (Maf/HAM1 superfamily)